MFVFLRGTNTSLLVLTVGTDLTHITIPPHMPHTDVVNECPSTFRGCGLLIFPSIVFFSPVVIDLIFIIGDCTSKFPGTLNVIGILPHMHLAGSKVSIFICQVLELIFGSFCYNK